MASGFNANFQQSGGDLAQRERGFIALHSLPGNVADILAGDVDYPGMREAIAAEWGLDKSLPEQYLDFLWRLAHGDLALPTSCVCPYRRCLRRSSGPRSNWP